MHDSAAPASELTMRRWTHLFCFFVFALAAGLGLSGASLSQASAQPPAADSEADAADDGIQVTAADALQHPERAAEEDERTDAHPHAEEEARDRMAARAGGVAPAGDGPRQRPENDPHDLRPEDPRATAREQPERAGGVAQKARPTDPHVAGIAQGHESGGSRPHRGHGSEGDGPSAAGEFGA